MQVPLFNAFDLVQRSRSFTSVMRDARTRPRTSDVQEDNIIIFFELCF